MRIDTDRNSNTLMYYHFDIQIPKQPKLQTNYIGIGIQVEIIPSEIKIQYKSHSENYLNPDIVFKYLD